MLTLLKGADSGACNGGGVLCTSPPFPLHWIVELSGSFGGAHLHLLPAGAATADDWLAPTCLVPQAAKEEVFLITGGYSLTRSIDSVGVHWCAHTFGVESQTQRP